MPQLVPFFFTNQTLSMFFLIALAIYTTSKYILPWIPRLSTSRSLWQRA